MVRIPSFEERFEYLKLGGSVGQSTAGFDRWINQRFYRSKEWKDLRHDVIYRDNGCDLGAKGHEIQGAVLIHHVNPVSVSDIVGGLDWILDPEFLVTTQQSTHNAIHYGDVSLLPKQHKDRSRGDTRLW